MPLLALAEDRYLRFLETLRKQRPKVHSRDWYCWLCGLPEVAGICASEIVMLCRSCLWTLLSPLFREAYRARLNLLA